MPSPEDIKPGTVWWHAENRYGSRMVVDWGHDSVVTFGGGWMELPAVDFLTIYRYVCSE